MDPEENTASDGQQLPVKESGEPLALSCRSAECVTSRPLAGLASEQLVKRRGVAAWDKLKPCSRGSFLTPGLVPPLLPA